MKPRIRICEFRDAIELASSLAGRVGGVLADACKKRGRATLAVSGGSTPAAFFEMLADADIPWKNITVTLVDERCVADNSERSNLKLVRDRLLRGRAAAANVLPLFPGGGMSPSRAAELADAAVAQIVPLDACILGMGTDGHTASLFPGGNNLQAALDPSGTDHVMAMTAPGATEARLTMTLPVIVGSAYLALHIEGSQKRDILDVALEPGPVADLPIRAVLDRAGDRVELFWAA